MPDKEEIGELSKTDIDMGMEVEWSVPNFLNFEETDRDKYTSPTYSFGGAMWFLEICPYESSKIHSLEYLNFVINKCSYDSAINLDISMSLATKNRERIFKKRTMLVGDDSNYLILTYNKIISRSELLCRKTELFHDGVLTVVCTMHIAAENERRDIGVQCTSQLEDPGAISSGLQDAPPPAMQKASPSSSGTIKCHSKKKTNRHNQSTGTKRKSSEIEEFENDGFETIQASCSTKPTKAELGTKGKSSESVEFEESGLGNWPSSYSSKPAAAELGLKRKISETVEIEDDGLENLQPSCSNKPTAAELEIKRLRTKEDNELDECQGLVSNFVNAAESSEAYAAKSTVAPHKKLHHDLKELLMEGEDYDVVFRVQGLEIPAHRNILRARSSVFKSMNYDEMNVIVVENCDPASFKNFLCFLYCGDVGKISLQNVAGLYNMANKYEVLDLRTMCVKVMSQNLTVETFCEIFSVNLEHCESELTNLTTNFFCENAEKIIETVQWKTFFMKNSTGCNTLVHKYLKSLED